MTPRRTMWSCPTLDDPSKEHDERRRATAYREETTDEAKANLIGSRVVGTKELHAPVIDIDFPCTLVPSTTPGHFHLYLDTVLTWGAYEKLLRVLGEVGIIEPGYMDASLERGQTFVRKPGVEKPKGAKDSGDHPASVSARTATGHARIDY